MGVTVNRGVIKRLTRDYKKEWKDSKIEDFKAMYDGYGDEGDEGLYTTLDKITKLYVKHKAQGEQSVKNWVTNNEEEIKEAIKRYESVIKSMGDKGYLDSKEYFYKGYGRYLKKYREKGLEKTIEGKIYKGEIKGVNRANYAISKVLSKVGITKRGVVLTTLIGSTVAYTGYIYDINLISTAIGSIGVGAVIRDIRAKGKSGVIPNQNVYQYNERVIRELINNYQGKYSELEIKDQVNTGIFESYTCTNEGRQRIQNIMYKEDIESLGVYISGIKETYKRYKSEKEMRSLVIRGEIG